GAPPPGPRGGGGGVTPPAPRGGGGGPGGPPPPHLWVDSVAVHPDAQGTGTGRRLLAFVETHARSLGLPEVRLLTNAKMWENQEMYARYGYEQVERRVEGEYDRFHYRKRLPA
ncbi:GNAT family N-acetyltransferase, partial [Streptomyces chryseus]